MTKKLTQFEPQLAMELDLDSFLNSHLSLSDEDDDDNLNSVPHRTIDEILNDSDSSSSPPSTIHRLASDPKPPHPPTDAVSVSSAKSDESSQVRPRPNLYARVKSGELSDDPVGKVSKPSPWLLGGMRTNAKPGAALAAAAAASRSMPTPHAAAIKSKRSAGSGVFQKVLESTELDDKSEVGSNSNNDTNVGSSEVTESNSNEGEVDFGDELLRKDRVWERERERELEETSQGIEVSAGNAPEEVKNVSFDENLTNLDANDVKDNEFNNNVEVVEECQPEIQDIDENSSGSKHSDSEEERLGDGGGGGNDNDGEGGGGGDDDDNNDRDSDDDGELGSSITQLVEERIGQLESRRISKKAEKKLQKPLEIAEELEKKQASTALHWEEGAAAQPMRLEGVRRGSTTLGYFNVDANNPITRTLSAPALRRDHGSPQVLAVHSNYIAIGMARGAILVIPSKYSAHNADIMDAKMLILGLQGERSYAAVTSICFNQQGDLLLAGYADGHITVWDVQRASVAKVITGEHTAPVVHTLFLGQDSQVTRQLKAVTGDSKGLVLLHSFSVVPLLNRFSIKTQCLLDGQRTGTVLSASPLLFDEFSGGASQSAQGNGTVTGSSIGGMRGARRERRVGERLGCCEGSFGGVGF
ncbi:uncharacterized protein LOC110764050 isoform X1 [Prunus avium]|uniref:Uncharacterized protein LOC110764050 isoform X1 n=1 Tax=Prunus avium TaxID=42229 RepID=A0A6P5T606_PRUAV|nr:uncharacterized protein LOC110764050 isoform X1 [Prunus avium]